jgi:hypothetical protein
LLISLALAALTIDLDRSAEIQGIPHQGLSTLCDLGVLANGCIESFATFKYGMKICSAPKVTPAVPDDLRVEPSTIECNFVRRLNLPNRRCLHPSDHQGAVLSGPQAIKFQDGIYSRQKTFVLFPSADPALWMTGSLYHLEHSVRLGSCLTLKMLKNPCYKSPLCSAIVDNLGISASLKKPCDFTAGEVISNTLRQHLKSFIAKRRQVFAHAANIRSFV